MQTLKRRRRKWKKLKSWNMKSPETKMGRLPYCRDVTVLLWRGYVYEQPSRSHCSIWLDASQRSRDGVWVNRSVREVKCKALWTVLRTGYCTILELYCTAQPNAGEMCQFLFCNFHRIAVWFAPLTPVGWRNVGMCTILSPLVSMLLDTWTL